MPKHQNHGLNDYATLNNFLGKKNERRYNKNCIIFRGQHKIGEAQKNTNAIFVQLYSSIIVIHLKIGLQIIPDNVYDSQTTKRYVRGFSRKDV